MAATSNTFEGLSNGTGITSGNSGGASGDAFDLMTLGSGATATADTSKSAHGSVSMKLATGVSAADCVAEWTTKIGSQTVNYGRAYLWIGSNPGTNHRLFDLVASPNLCGAIYLTTTGKLQPVDTGGGQMTITTNSVALSQWIRIEWKYTASTTVGQAEIRLYNTADSTTATETQVSAASFNTQASFNEYRFGAAGDPMPANRTVWYDDIGLSTVDFLGPAATPTPLVQPAHPGVTWQRQFKHRQTLFTPISTVAVTLADAALAVTAGLTADATSAKPVDAALTATATATATGTATKPVDAALSGTATGTAAITSTKSAAATLTATATITADATITPAGKTIDGALTVTAAITATGTSTKSVDAALTVTSTATAAATGTKPVDAALTATATGTATQTATKPIAAALAATATITASGTVTGANVVQADAALTATANRTATVTATKSADAFLAVTATITATGTVTGPVVAGTAQAAVGPVPTANAADGAIPTAITATGAAAAASSSAQAAAAAVSASMTTPTATGA